MNLPSLRWRWSKLSCLSMGLTLAVAVFYIGPLLSLVLGAVRDGAPGQSGDWTLQAWAQVWGDRQLHKAIVNALWLSLINLLVALPLAASLVILAVRSNLPGRTWVTPAMVVMFSLPTLFYAMGYELLANPYTGLMNSVFRGLGSGLKVNIESFSGLALVNTFRCIAFTYLFLLGPVRALSHEQDEASRVCGRGGWVTFWRISLVGLAPALTGAALFALIGGLEVFDLAMIIGVPANIPVLAVQLYDWLSLPQPRYAAASVVSLGLVGVLAVAIAVQIRLTGARSFVAIGGKAARPRPMELGVVRWPLAALVWFYISVAQLLPIATLVYASFQPLPGVVGALSAVHYRSVLYNPSVADALISTLVLATSVGALTSALGMGLAHLQLSLPRRMQHLLRFSTLVPLAMPGVVLALAITWAYVNTPGLRSLYGTFAMMSIALVVSLTPLAMQIGQASVAQIHPSLNEAARVSGVAPLKAWLDTTVRLSMPGFLVGWYLALIGICGSLDIPMLLGGPGLETLATLIYTFNTRGQTGAAAALLCLLLALILTPPLLLALHRALRTLWRKSYPFERNRDESYRPA
ncbi:iron ABC transporter permease [Pseudomonas sp. S31]|uniref:ABC transporter permease n=1 Tax=Pseudomonas sp. S31 TaxID=1564473 RepID=UPI0019117888|nr:iron ABC transporter permease [Pseudomonas sp. S31]MBK4999738.1 iron ABC transporter permease [Pseudomonas sp. S31]